MSRVLSVNHLTKRFGSTTAVEEINFSIEPGQALGLLGPNGAGKTTTMRILQGALRPTSGSISIFGHAPLSVPNINRHRLRCLRFADFPDSKQPSHRVPLRQRPYSTRDRRSDRPVRSLSPTETPHQAAVHRGAQARESSNRDGMPAPSSRSRRAHTRPRCRKLPLAASDSFTTRCKRRLPSHFQSHSERG